MKPRGSSNTDDARKGEFSGESESIEARAVCTFLVSLKRATSRRPFPAGIEPTFKFTSENLTFITTETDK
jgi:hypothetical protein